MDFNAIIKRAIAIITKPKEEWEVIKNESMTIADMYVKYAIILAAIPAVAGFIGWVAIGKSIAFGTLRIPVGNALAWAVLTYVLSLGGVYLMAFIIDALAPSFGSKKDMNRSMKAVVFSYTAAWIGGIFNLIPALSIIASLCGIYTLVLLYMGMKTTKEVPQDKMVGYYIVSLVIAIVVFFIIFFIASRIAFGSVGASFLY